MNQRYLLIAAVVLILVAAVMFGRQMTNKEGQAVAARSAEEQIREIQNNPNMPEQAKAIAIGQIQASSQKGNKNNPK
jgi:uncharacterized membrane protein YbaN (DUF454 family)